MGDYIAHTATLRSPETARYHALRIGRWCEGQRASQAVQVAQQITRDLTGHYAPATINRSLGALKAALRAAWMNGLTTVNHGDRIRRLAENNIRETTLTLAQVRTLAEHASETTSAAIWIALYTACRRGELLAIEPGDIGPETILIRAGNTKTLKTRVVPIVAPLRPWLAHIPLALTAEGLKTGFRRAREAAGMPHVTMHDLRRSCATLMIEAGVELQTVSKLLGHSSVSITAQRYAHLQIERVREGLDRTFDPAHRPAHRPPGKRLKVR